MTTIFSNDQIEFQKALKQSENWFADNGVTFNPKECNLVSFANNQLSEINYAKETLQNSLKTKYLGLIIDNKLNFESHTDKENKKVRWFNGLYKTRNFFSTKQLLMFYNAYAKSIIEYAILTYGSASKTELQSVNLLQKRFIRTIFRKSYCESVQTLAIQHKFYSVYELYTTYLFKNFVK